MDIDFRIALICTIFEASYENNVDLEQTVQVCFCANILVNNLNVKCIIWSSRLGCNDKTQFLAGFLRLHQT